MKDDKYIVFKRNNEDNDDGRYYDGDDLEDAVVIRTRDLFAAGGLYAYANNIHAWCEVEARDLEGIPRHQARERFDRLDRARVIADYFAERAYEAEDSDARKFPD